MVNTADQDVAGGLGARLAAAQQDVDGKRRALDTATKVRNRLVFEALDQEGRSQRWVAQALGKSRSLVHYILAGGED